MKSPILVDTNTFIWLTQDPQLLGPRARRLLRQCDVLVSPLTALEIKIKISVKKLKLLDNVPRLIQKHQLTVLPYSIEQASAYQMFDDHNRDPFDNALIAGALTEQVSFMTGDYKILELAPKYPWIIDARV